MRRAVGELDRRAFREMVGRPTARQAAFLRRFSAIANRSSLWQAISLLLVVTGGARGRRAASRGMVSVAITSAVVNLGVKHLSRRQRPDISSIDAGRLLRRRPASSSFPSGHAASAAAYAAAVGAEWPVAALPVGAVALTVALSRVTSGAHYPGDVLAGVASGSLVALAVRRLWPRPLPEQTARQLGRLEVDPAGSGLVIVVNDASGSWSPRLREHLREALPLARLVSPGDPESLTDVLRREAVQSRVLGVVGGDGTVNAALDLALALDRPLLVIPGGTLNHLCRDLGLDGAGAALEAYRAGRVTAIDVGRIGDRPFVNTASAGAYVALVDRRERWQARLGKWPAAMLSLLSVLATAQPIDVTVDGVRERVWWVFAGNCRYRPEGIAPVRRERLDDGLLDIRFARAPTGGRGRAADVLALLRRRGLVESRCCTEFAMAVHAPGRVRLSRDGETFPAPGDVRVHKDPRRLVVFCAAP